MFKKNQDHNVQSGESFLHMALKSEERIEIAAHLIIFMLTSIVVLYFNLLFSFLNNIEAAWLSLVFLIVLSINYQSVYYNKKKEILGLYNISLENNSTNLIHSFLYCFAMTLFLYFELFQDNLLFFILSLHFPVFLFVNNAAAKYFSAKYSN